MDSPLGSKGLLEDPLLAPQLLPGAVFQSAQVHQNPSLLAKGRHLGILQVTQPVKLAVGNSQAVALSPCERSHTAGRVQGLG